ncbi:phage portal protein [Rhizobium herbae]|uniref:HK97 family phage portal protein n=1 Tax=Rhizobium herbae TaxID=508661 RepID=A0ABS4EFQ2_9HYPH|nr:phage portal protein [Rhizobium herbae]MBP1856773.1 HK97 family phage portal protein [Rhizobium herbae]
MSAGLPCLNWSPLMWPFKRETRIASSDPFLGEFLGTRWQAVADIEKATGLSVAHRCIDVVASSLAMSPLSTYREDEAGDRTEDMKHPLYALLTGEPWPGVSAFEFKEWLYRSVLIHGNAYARIHRNGRSQITGLEPLWKGLVTVEELTTGRVRYRYQPRHGGVEIISQDDILHLKFASRDGIMGQSPVQIAAAAFGLATAQSEQAGAQAVNSFRPSGALVLPEKIGGDGKTAALARMKERFIGSTKAGDFMVLDGGAKFETFQFSARDSEFLESRKLSNLDICRVWGVPPSVAGITDGASYSSAAEESRALVTRCLRLWAARFEGSLMVSLLSPDARKTLYIEHDLSRLMEASQKDRYEAYNIGRNGGWLSVNDIRRDDNRPKIKGGDAYLEPLNMGIVGQPRPAVIPGAPSGSAGEQLAQVST